MSPSPAATATLLFTSPELLGHFGAYGATAQRATIRPSAGR